MAETTLGAMSGLATVARMSRDPWLDNAKLTLVTLVVVGHSLGLLAVSVPSIQLFTFIYYWHIPAFVLISGHLSRSFEWDRRHLSTLVTAVLLPYLIFEPALLFFRNALGQHEDGAVLLVPHWAMWYLLVLFLWRLVTPLLKRHWSAVPMAVMISLIGGISDEKALCLTRFLGLLPFFALGLHLDRDRLRRLTDPRLRPLAAGVLVAVLVTATTTNAWGRTGFLFYDDGYASLGFSATEGMLVRSAVMVLGLLGAWSVLTLIPRRGHAMSTWGGATLVVYLFHGFFVKFAGAAGLFDFAADRPVTGMLLCGGFAVGLSLVLASPPVASRLSWAVDPVGCWKRARIGGLRLANGA